MEKIRIDDEGWARCGHCGRKQFKIVKAEKGLVLEIKCHSCKKINTLEAQCVIIK